MLLAIIGDRWLDIRFADGPAQGQRRLDDPNDWVRLEIASALKRDILVVPVLVGKVSMPDISPGLPPDLADLTKKVALVVRTGPDLPNDLQLLVRGVKRAIRLSPLTPSDLALPLGVKVAPQGLRSFNEHDNGFFIYLLPGPYREDGLPERLCFWKTRIEATDVGATFRVGLIYGPSGCGKSSLVRAGLLPCLGKHVTVVYVEATPIDTETRLSAALQEHCPYLAGESSLRAALEHKGQIPSNQKVLIVLDQFEQYLHSTPEDEQDELAEALRECDGGKLQCILMVRDDFLTPVTRFMDRLQIAMSGDRNLALVDLFDRRHAKKVLALLGQAYGGLPASGSLRKEQDAFLNQAISDLSEGDHVICVRLALFAAMVKDKQWKPATLKAIGGATGVGVAFLEESFAAQAAPAENRRHKAAAQRVLSALLPEPGTSIKGAMRTKQELQKQSGYARRPDQFRELLDILDKKLRLVTPTDPAGKSSDGQPEQVADAERRYQLTHDYLVPSLRDWLNSKKKETRNGRAELRLEGLATQWNAFPAKRQLPAWWEWLSIELFTRRTDWTPPQRKMMRAAGQYHAVRGLTLLLLLVVTGIVGMSARNAVVEKQNSTRAEGLVGALVNAHISKVPDIVTSLEKYRTWADPLLQARFDQAKEGSSQRLNMALALLPVDATRADYLCARLLAAQPDEVAVIRVALSPHKDSLTGKLWSVVAQPAKGKESQRLRAASALATYDPSSQRWEKAAGEVSDDLVKAPAVYLATWMDLLRPVQSTLLKPVAVVFGDMNRGETERLLATDILADYAADQPKVLAALLMDANGLQFAVLYPKLTELGERGTKCLLAEINRQPQPKWSDPPLNPAWPKPDTALVQKIESAQGILAERFAFCQTMPLKEFAELAEGLRKSGYRPTRFRPYPVGHGVNVAAVWTRDGQAWQLAHGLAAEEVVKRDAELRKQSCQPVDVGGYTSGGKEQYAAVWVKAPADAPATRLDIGLEERQWRNAAEPLRKGGYRPTMYSAVTSQDGTIRHCWIWSKVPGENTPGYQYRFGMIEPNYSGENFLGELQVDVQVSLAGPVLGTKQGFKMGKLDRRYAAVWHSSAQLVSTEIHGLDPGAHLAECRARIAQGYRPASLSVVDAGSGQRVAASVWHRPLVPEEEKEKLAKRQANAAVALLKMNHVAEVWPLLKHSPDPRVRSCLIHRLGPLGADAKAVVKRLEEEPDVTIRRASC